MPYRNPRNISVAQQMSGINQTHINREQQINDFSTTSEVSSQLESMVMRRPEVHGGSGYAAATNKDLGFEPTLGATGGADATAAKRRVRKKAIEVGEGLSAAGISAGGVSCGGAPAAGAPAPAATAVGGSAAVAKPKGTRKKKEGGALLTLRDMDSMQGQPPETVRAKETIKAEGMAVGSGGGAKGGRSKRNEVVREVMKKHGLSLPQASKFVKEHNLY